MRIDDMTGAGWTAFGTQTFQTGPAGTNNVPPGLFEFIAPKGIRLTPIATPACAPFGGPTPLVAAILPSSRSVQVGTPATAFATILNAGETTATGVRITTTPGPPIDFVFQTTNPNTNAVTGTANTVVDIPPGGGQTFVISLTPTAAFTSTTTTFDFCGTNAGSPSTIPGVNTLLFSGSATPIPDVVALAATISNDGIVNVPGATGTGAFAVATVNVGATGAITATADTGWVALSVNIALCQTNPATGQCTSAIAGSVTTTIAQNATPTFAIFVTGTGTVPFDPATNRIFVKFTDASAITRGSTSVAVRTQ